jgi:ABC-type Fe3+-hydroxamate transport system substrate-binding protein
MKTPNSCINFSPIPGFRSLVALLLGMSVLFSGCVTMKSVPVSAPGRSAEALVVKVGDKVEVQTTTGEKYAFTVTAIEPDTLAGKIPGSAQEVRVKFQNMASLQVAKVDPARTALAGAGGIVILVGVAVLVFLLSGGIHLNPM